VYEKKRRLGVDQKEVNWYGSGESKYPNRHECIMLPLHLGPRQAHARFEVFVVAIRKEGSPMWGVASERFSVTASCVGIGKEQ